MTRFFGLFAQMKEFFSEYCQEQDFYYKDTIKVYDQLSKGYGDFDSFYQLAMVHQGPILDLCCGSGRLLLPLAKKGFEIDGVDLSQDMLDELHIQLHKNYKRAIARVHVYCQDMHHLALPRKYNLIIIGATSIRLLQGDFTTFFNQMYELLNPGGCLAFTYEDCNQPSFLTDSALTVGPVRDSQGRLNILFIQRELDTDGKYASVNIMKVVPDSSEKILLSKTGYRVFGGHDLEQAAEASLFEEYSQETDIPQESLFILKKGV